VGAIRGHTVELRPVEESDAPFVHRWMNQPEIWRYMDYERRYSLADVLEDIQAARGSGQPFTILVDGRPIGRVGLNQFRDRDRICSLYLYIGEPECWGRGYARDAVMTLLAFAFDRWDLHQVELWTLSDNDRAIPMYRRCGFVEEAMLRDRSFKEGRWVGHTVMSVNRDEFAKARATWDADAPGIVTQDSQAT
jgi:RimJ/RimL family protein N-acetyltransferase